MNTEELKFENEYLKKRNKELHRRLQQKESPLQSEVNRLRLRLEWKERDCSFTFNRLVDAHREMNEIFQMIAPLYNIPCKNIHSVTNSNASDSTLQGGIWANVLIDKKGPVKSYRVINLVRKLVDEMTNIMG